MTIRPATLSESDLDAIIRQRRAIYLEVGYRDEDRLDLMCGAFREWLRRKMEKAEYLGWFADTGEAIAAGVGVWLIDCPPSMRAEGNWRGEILNVFTEPSHRRQGFARVLMEAAIAWCDAHGISVMLHTTSFGRPLYESLGFVPRDEMELIRRQ